MERAGECPFRSPTGEVQTHGRFECGLIRQLAPDFPELAIVDQEDCRCCQSSGEPHGNSAPPYLASYIYRWAKERLQDVQAPGAQRTQLARSRQFAYEQLPFALTAENVKAQAAPVVKQLCSRCAQADVTPVPSPCVRLLREPSTVIGNGVHLSGWPYAIDGLRGMLCRNGILLDDFVEQRFSYVPIAVPTKEPWIGIFHHPPAVPAFVHRAHHLPEIFRRADWLESRTTLVGTIALSEYLADYLRTELQLPCVTVKHPAKVPQHIWSMNAYLQSRPRRLLQLGWHLRNTRAIHQVQVTSAFQRVRLLSRHRWILQYDRNVQRYWDHKGGRRETAGVIELDFIPARQLEEFLCNSIVLTELFDASANNVIVDCIARNTPLVINRHPAAVEYLTESYPLFYDDLSEIPALLTDARICDGHFFLARMDKSWLSNDAFANRIGAAVAHFRSQATGQCP